VTTSVKSIRVYDYSAFFIEEKGINTLDISHPAY